MADRVASVAQCVLLRCNGYCRTTAGAVSSWEIPYREILRTFVQWAVVIPLALFVRPGFGTWPPSEHRHALGRGGDREPFAGWEAPTARRLATGSRANAGLPRSGGSADDGGAMEGREGGEGVAVMAGSYRASPQATAPSKNCTVSGCRGMISVPPSSAGGGGGAHAGVAVACDMGLPGESRPHRGRHPWGGEGVGGSVWAALT